MVCQFLHAHVIDPRSARIGLNSLAGVIQVRFIKNAVHQFLIHNVHSIAFRMFPHLLDCLLRLRKSIRGRARDAGGWEPKLLRPPVASSFALGIFYFLSWVQLSCVSWFFGPSLLSAFIGPLQYYGLCLLPLC